ncbi:MAG: DUF559 domain-containing protein [Hamadaea sp.]|uniref:DUF559 domain-containing protein n=1 Tax=Hamadaea sp. TaxID=2024425 RepID=UPI0017E11EC6|nr:DUF559 domain-containing protein [Hamadaea sp.]NUR71350.1 DUF559 domain-containing protein [Hamadaea sp.]NUT23519.1 DUF559 domain-containing protein [Hamadaea sp.]
MPRPARIPQALAVAPFRGSDAVRAGLLTHRQLSGPTWTRLFPDVYLLAENPVDHRVLCEAAALLLPEGGAIGGLSALRLWGLAPLGEPDAVTLLVPRGQHMRRHDGLDVRRGRLASDEVTGVLGPPVTTSLRTAFDIARLQPRTHALICLDSMLKQKKVYLDGLTAFFAAHPGWPGRRRADALLTEVEPLTESPMETRLRLLILDAGLPRPAAQYKIMNGKRFVARVDFAYPQYRIAIEYDGDHHRELVTHRFDMERQNELSALGWTVLRFHADDVLRRPAETAAKIRAVVERTARKASR